MAENNRKDPIEQLFQKQAEEYDISFREEDWLKMEEQLDRLDQQYAYRWKRGLIAASLVLLFSLLAFAIYQNYSRINELTEQLNEEQLANNSQDGEQTDQQQLPTVLEDEDSTENIENSTSSSGEEMVESVEEEGENNNSMAESSSSQASPDMSQGIAGRGVQGNAFDTSELYVENISCLEECSPATFTTLALERTPEKLALSAPPSPVSSEADEDVHSPSDNAASRVALSFIAGPDFSTAGSFSNFYNPGYTVGVKIEYALAPRLSVSTGVIHSDIRYSAQKEDYNPPATYWNNGILPERTIAECLILDIPLNLKYDVVNFSNSRLYATAGVSSYIMLNEEYRFSYQQNNPGLARTWSERTGTSHWMSNTVFSVGYELDIGTSWSIRAEPTIKMPIRGVGWGDVDLYSIESTISISYNIFR